MGYGPEVLKLRFSDQRVKVLAGIADSFDDSLIDWIGLRENLQETIDFPIKNGAFL